MVHISHHKSHRSRKRRDRSVSDDEDIPKEKKQRLDVESVRISRSPDQDNRSRSSNHVVLVGKGNAVSDHGKRQKDIGDRWNGDGDKDTKVGKEAKGENSETEFEQRSKGKLSSSSSKKCGDISEKIDQKRMDKQRSRRESNSNLHKGSKEKVKEREKERVYAKEKEMKGHNTKHEVEASDLSVEMDDSEQTKEIGRPYKRSDKYGDNKKVHDSRDGQSKRSYKDGRYKEEYDREYRHYNEKRKRDEHSSRTQSEISDSLGKKIKLQCGDNGGSHYDDDHMTKHIDSKGRKRLSEEIGDQTEVRNQSAKKPCVKSVKCRPSSTKNDSPDRAKAEQSYVAKTDSSASSIRLKISPRTGYPANDQNRDESRQIKDVRRPPSVVRERISEFRSPMKESDLSPQSVSLNSPNHLPKKVPYTNQQLPAERGQKSNSAVISNAFNNHIPPSPSVNKFRSPSAMGFYEDELRNQNTQWKSSGSRWPSPVVANCFMPVQHGPPLGFPHQAVPQFPSNVGPYNNVHMHSYSMQMWDENPNMQVYGRQEWDQNRLLISNRIRNASSNNNTWNGQNGNMYTNHNNATQKETEYPYGERMKPEKQYDGVSKISLDVSDLSKSAVVTTPELVKMSSVRKTSETKVDNNFSYISYYLSKLDVSPDLAHPDVYKQYMLLMEAKDVKSASQNLSMGLRKNNLDSFRPVAKSRQSLLPHPLDSIFQKAMTLFNKQKEGSNLREKVEDVMDEEEKKNDTKAGGTISEANVQEVNNIVKGEENHPAAMAITEETGYSANAADSSTDDVVSVKVSDKHDNIANLKSVGVNIIHLSAESTR